MKQAQNISVNPTILLVILLEKEITLRVILVNVMIIFRDEDHYLLGYNAV
jgi:hypothetical protein